MRRDSISALTNLDRLRQKSVANLAAPPINSKQRQSSRAARQPAAASASIASSRHFAGYFGYANTHSKNTGATYNGKVISYVPAHRPIVGPIRAGDQRALQR